MKRHTRLTSEQQESRLVGTEQQTQQTPAREFATPEEMLRYDAAHTPVPPGVAQRLREAGGQPPTAPYRPWWRRLFGGPPQ
jgi:hypothetical protein